MSVIDIKPDAQGKVRDLYDLGDKLLLVASDRISAFDYILEDEIPYKGQVLTQLSSGSTFCPMWWTTILSQPMLPTFPSSSSPMPISLLAVSCW